MGWLASGKWAELQLMAGVQAIPGVYEGQAATQQPRN